MSAKAKILAKLKARVADADLDKLPLEPQYKPNAREKALQYQQFVDLLKKNQAKVVETTEAQLANAIERELEALDMSRLLYPKNTEFSQIIESVTAQVTLTAFDFELDEQGKSVIFDEIDAGITTCHSAIAALGAIVLWPDTNEPRSLSLVPEAHFVIVKREQIYADFPSVIAHQNWQDNMPTNIVLVSGPSKTGDIQQHMAFGAHGPKHLIVLVIHTN